MEKLKELLIIALIWVGIIWFAQTMKRKSKEQAKKFEENIPEMEPIKEEERSYICKNLEFLTTGKNVFLWLLILLNLWVTIGYSWKAINTGINGTVGAFSDNVWAASLFGGIAYAIHLVRKEWFRERESNEKGVLKKRIVEVQQYKHQGANNVDGIIKGKNPEINVKISIENGAVYVNRKFGQPLIEN